MTDLSSLSDDELLRIAGQRPADVSAMSNDELARIARVKLPKKDYKQLILTRDVPSVEPSLITLLTEKALSALSGGRPSYGYDPDEPTFGNKMRTGVQRGIAGLVGVPRDVGEAIAGATEWAGKQLGSETVEQEGRSRREQLGFLPSSEFMRRKLEKMQGGEVEAETPIGKIAQGAAQGAATGPFGLGAAGWGAAAGAAEEVAGQLTGNDPIARAIASLFPLGATGAARRTADWWGAPGRERAAGRALEAGQPMTAENQAMQARLGRLAGDKNVNEASRDVAGVVTRAYDEARDAEKAAWNAFDPKGAVQVGTKNFKRAVNRHLDQLNPTQLSYIPKDVLARINGYDPKIALVEVKDLRSDLLSRARLSKEPEVAKVLNDFANGPILRRFETAEVPPSSRKAFEKAAAATADVHERFPAMSSSRFIGEDVTKPSLAAEKFVDLKKGTPEGIDNLMAAVGPGRLKGEALRAARDFAAADLLRVGKRGVTGTDLEGAAMLNGRAMRDWLTKNQEVVDKVFTHPAQRDLIEQLVTRAEVMQRRAPGGVKDVVMEKIPQGRILDRVLGAISSTAGAAGGAAAGGPLGAAIGSAAGRLSTAGRYGAINTLVLDALADPNIARTLLMKATRGNEAIAANRLGKWAQTALVATTDETE